MTEFTWEYCKVGRESDAIEWRRVGSSLDVQLQLEDPPKFIAVSNSAYAAYNNSTLKYQFVEKTNDVHTMLKYKHFKDNHPPLYFRHICKKALTVKVAAVKDKRDMEITIYSAITGDFMTKLVVDRQIRVSTCKSVILDKLIQLNSCTRQTGLIFVNPNDNNGHKKMTTILNFKDAPAQPVKRGIPELFEGAKKKSKKQ